jgi:hypothetical protein
MPDPADSPVSARLPVARPPRWATLKGLCTGAVIEVPVLAAAVWLIARLGIGDRSLRFMTLLRMTAVFAGIAALITAAGIGRLAAYASVEHGGGRKRAVTVAGRAHAVAGAALTVIAVIPNGHLPAPSALWLVVPVVGAIAGWACGAMIGVVCGGAAPIGLSDVVALARTPGAALRQLLDPEDLLKIGAAVRDRTSRVFEGMFEPAKRPPGDDDAPKPK